MIGLIEVNDSPIRWINLVEGRVSGGSGESTYSYTLYSNWYYIPDSNFKQIIEIERINLWITHLKNAGKLK